MDDARDARRAKHQAEARRRAAIVARYAKLDRPSREDDRRHADELGLSVDSLWRLTAAWKAHGDRAPIRGARTVRPDGNGTAAQAIMATDIDLEGVRPDRRDETLRRIRVIQSYLDNPSRTAEDRLARAREMGVSPNRFDMVVRQWCLHPKACLMPGAAPVKRRYGFRSPERIRVHEILHGIVRSSDPGRTVKSIHDDLVEACASEGLKPLALPRLYPIVRQLRTTKDTQ